MTTFAVVKLSIKISILIMKKLFILLFVSIFTLSANATLTSAERQFLNTIKNYLNNEGYRASIDDEDDLVFKIEGENFWYSIQTMKEGYFYVSFHKDGLQTTDANMNAVYKAASKVCADLKAIKCYVRSTGTGVSFAIESFYTSANDVIKFFQRHVDILQSAEKEVKEYYSELE